MDCKDLTSKRDRVIETQHEDWETMKCPVRYKFNLTGNSKKYVFIAAEFILIGKVYEQHEW